MGTAWPGMAYGDCMARDGLWGLHGHGGSTVNAWPCMVYDDCIMASEDSMALGGLVTTKPWIVSSKRMSLDGLCGHCVTLECLLRLPGHGWSVVTV